MHARFVPNSAFEAKLETKSERQETQTQPFLLTASVFFSLRRRGLDYWLRSREWSFAWSTAQASNLCAVAATTHRAMGIDSHSFFIRSCTKLCTTPTRKKPPTNTIAASRSLPISFQVVPSTRIDRILHRSVQWTSRKRLKIIRRQPTMRV